MSAPRARGGATPRAERAHQRCERASEGGRENAMKDGYAECALRAARWALVSAPRVGLRHDKAVWEA
jgi:hypothetical protein